MRCWSIKLTAHKWILNVINRLGLRWKTSPGLKYNPHCRLETGAKVQECLYQKDAWIPDQSTRIEDVNGSLLTHFTTLPFESSHSLSTETWHSSCMVQTFGITDGYLNDLQAWELHVSTPSWSLLHLCTVTERLVKSWWIYSKDKWQAIQGLRHCFHLLSGALSWRNLSLIFVQRLKLSSSHCEKIFRSLLKGRKCNLELK